VAVGLDVRCAQPGSESSGCRAHREFRMPGCDCQWERTL
jgi:hypothetical protein